MDYCYVFFCSDNPEAKAILWAAVIAAIPALLAVFGAYRIGRRQLELLDYQAALQGEIGIRAATIEETKIRADLFDRRMTIYSAVQRFKGAILIDGEPPQFKKTGPLEDIDQASKISREFLTAMAESKFLFSQKVHDSLVNDLWMKSNDLHFHNTSKVYDGLDHAARSTQLITELKDYDLDTLMGDKLRL